jgi:hypothetical protein
MWTPRYFMTCTVVILLVMGDKYQVLWMFLPTKLGLDLDHLNVINLVLARSASKPLSVNQCNTSS